MERENQDNLLTVKQNMDTPYITEPDEDTDERVDSDFRQAGTDEKENLNEA